PDQKEAQPGAGAQGAPVPEGADAETYRQVLQEQLSRGVAQRVAEGRARAAGMKAAREKAGAG
ncbi:MAG: hypothetical protein M3245_03920, partial [Actinomycetota bacterium]|nr:hypothetical protein [Actinomycetota bacterium]